MPKAAVVDVRVSYLGEPLLQFCTGRSSDPKTGLTTDGPYSLRTGTAPRHAKVGVIGSAETIAAATNWVRVCASGVKGDAEHPDFPGCSADSGFFVDLAFDDDWNRVLTRNERASVIEGGPRQRFEAAGRLFDEKLGELAGMDAPPDYVILALPDDIVDACGVVKYREKGRPISRDLRRLLKAVAMRHRLPTQLLRTRTIAGGPKVDDLSRCAWNFFTGLYFKLGVCPGHPSAWIRGHASSASASSARLAAMTVCARA